MTELDKMLDKGQPVGMLTSVFYLDYLPAAYRFHFNAHNIIVYGKEDDKYLISDPVMEGVTSLSSYELERVRSQSGLFLTVDRYENLLRSGRVSRGKAWLAGMLDVKPILSLDQTGRVVPVDRVRGRDQLVARVLQWVDRALTPRPRALRFGIAHAESPETAERLRTALVAAYQPRDCFVALATGVLGTHAGPGAWAVCYQVEDGTPELQGKESRG